uniref:Uncharacterized protein n=1 Tax=viral metagenome TaxID=1070528 RepID=A0A6C0J8X5_9ZZZZ
MSAKNKSLKKLPEFEYRIPVKYDSAFRSRIENNRLRNAHPKVKKIHVAHRDTVKKSSGIKIINIIIAAPTKKIADDCFNDGNRTILKSMENNRTSKRTKNNRTNKRTNNRTKRSPNNRTKNNRTKNNRPTVSYPEDVSSETDWGDYENRRYAYQQNHPQWKIV